MTKNTDSGIKPIRVFFGIFPNKLVQMQLAHQAELLQAVCGGRAVKMRHIHLTLLFLGNVTITQIEALRLAMQDISAKEFELDLDEICYWKRNQIFYIQAKQFPAELFALVDSFKDAVSKAGFLFDERSYKPHITLIRKAIQAEKITLDNPIKWHVNEWSLIHSKQTGDGMDYISLDHRRLK